MAHRLPWWQSLILICSLVLLAQCAPAEQVSDLATQMAPLADLAALATQVAPIADLAEIATQVAPVVDLADLATQVPSAETLQELATQAAPVVDLAELATQAPPLEQVPALITQAVSIEDLEALATQLAPIADLAALATQIAPVSDAAGLATQVAPVLDLEQLATQVAPVVDLAALATQAAQAGVSGPELATQVASVVDLSALATQIAQAGTPGPEQATPMAQAGTPGAEPATATAELPEATPTPVPPTATTTVELPEVAAPEAPPTSTATPLTAAGTSAPTAVTVAAGALREGPGAKYPQVAKLKKGSELYVIGQTANCKWLRVVTANQQEGWVAGGKKQVKLQTACADIPSSTYRPLSGMVLSQDKKKGRGTLTVDNGTESDAYAVLASTADKPVLSAYVRAGTKFTIKGIRDGVYHLFFATGQEWDNTTRAFTVDPRYQRFEDEFKFKTGARTYTTWKVTLQPVVGGTAATEDVDPGQFPGSTTP